MCRYQYIHSSAATKLNHDGAHTAEDPFHFGLVFGQTQTRKELKMNFSIGKVNSRIQNQFCLYDILIARQLVSESRKV